MTELKTKMRKTQYWLKHDFFTFDNVILLVAAVFCLVWTWGSISSMTRNWTLAEEVMNREREKALLELEVATIELENEYYASTEYQELAARRYQNKKLEGETMIYLPANSDAAKHKHDAQTDESTTLVMNDMSNFEQWMAFLFGL